MNASTLIQTLTTFGPYIIGLLVALTILRLWKRRLGIASIDKRLAADRRLVNQAIAEVDGDQSRIVYLEIVIGEELQTLTTAYTKAANRRYLLGSLALLAGFASIAINGTAASIPNFASTTQLSFGVNIVGEVATGLLLFFQFESTAVLNLKLARELRIELSSYMASTNEYFGLDTDLRWNLFTKTVEAMLLSSYAPIEQGSLKPEKEQEEQPQD